MIEGMFGKRMERHLGLPATSTLLLSANPSRQLALTWINAPKGLEGPSRRIPIEKAYSLSVHLRRPGAVEGWGSWTGGQFRSVKFWDLGGLEIFNLQADPIVLRPSAFETIHIHLPQQTIDSYFHDSDEPPLTDLHCAPGLGDDTLYRWVKMLVRKRPVLAVCTWWCSAVMMCGWLMLK